MGCSPSTYPTNHDRATDPLTHTSHMEGHKMNSRFSNSRSSVTLSERGEDCFSSSLSSSEHRRRRRNSLGKKSSSRERRGSWEQTPGFARQRSSEENKEKPRSTKDMKRKDTPASFENVGPPGVKSAVSQLTSSQIDFFRMLDEKIAQGHDYESESEVGVPQRPASNAIDLMYKSEARTQQVS